MTNPNGCGDAVGVCIHAAIFPYRWRVNPCEGIATRGLDDTCIRGVIPGLDSGE